MKKRAIVTGGEAKDIFAMGVLALNLKTTNPDYADELVIFHNGVKESDQRIISTIFPTKFIKYEFPKKRVLFSNIVKFHFSEMVFCKYECLTLLKDYREVTWSDYDVVILDDISELKTKSKTGLKFLSYRLDPLKEQFFKSIEEENMEAYNLNDLACCASCFALDDTLNYEEMYNFCIEKTIQYGKHLYLPEQAIFGLMFNHFNRYPEFISANFSRHPNKNIDYGVDTNLKTIILHSYGSLKFWTGVHNDTWNKYYQEWLYLGGSPYKKASFCKRAINFCKRMVNSCRKGNKD